LKNSNFTISADNSRELSRSDATQIKNPSSLIVTKASENRILTNTPD
jgi:hypothetical protein